jgi:hypothetical protein
MGRSWELVGGHGWHAFGTLVVAWLVTGVIDSVITLPFGDTSWVVQGGGGGGHGHPALWVLVGVLLYLDLRARKESLTWRPYEQTSRPQPPDAIAAKGSGWSGSGHGQDTQAMKPSPVARPRQPEANDPGPPTFR